MALSKWDMYCVLCNFLVGAGILAIPKAFQTGGILVTFALLLIVALINWLLHREILEITEELSLPQSPNEPLLDTDRQLKSPHQWDLPAIVHKTMGPLFYAIYFPFFTAYVVIVVATYSNIFGQTTGALFGCYYSEEYTSMENDCKTKYHLGTLVFMIITGILAVIDYEKQIWMHRLMVVIQFVFTTLIVVFAIDFFLSTDYKLQVRHIPNSARDFLYAFQVIMFACWYLTATPSVLAASAKHHNSQKKVAFWIFASSMIIYSVVGLVAGTVLVDVSNNNINFFKEYHSVRGEQSFLLLAILVVPALDIISNSPIICQTLSGALFTAFYGTNHNIERKSHPYIHILLRVSTVIPPFLLASLFPKFVIFR